ncbi:MAG: penicillin-binding transpeptidase domain-containing protein [Bacillota bacterium]|nr:penicillin-binding transpeptidase domain-containing protein [Bacillota bacterium]
MSDRERRRILILLSAIVILLIGLTVYTSYFMIFQGETYRTSAQNKRNRLEAANVIRGEFYDRNNLVLVQNIKGEKGLKRDYVYPELYSHIIGYTYPNLGKSGLELSLDSYLTNQNKAGLAEAIKKYFEKESVGNSIKLTIDTKIQKKASELLGSNKGAIVALNPNTGELYCMVSKPSFNVNMLQENWEDLSQNPDSVLFNRAINGLYPPGSVMKVISTAAILDQDVDLSYDHTGSQLIDGYEYKDATEKKYGQISLDKAFTSSLNTYFVKKIQDVGMTKFASTAGKFMFEKDIPFELKVSKSTLNYNSSTTVNQVSATAIGQGRALATPMEMALTAAAIANDGSLVQPHLVKEIRNSDGDLVKELEVKELSRAVDPEIARHIKELMVKTTNEGTGKNAAIRNVQVASKTGTAENETENPHAWYIGFAPAENPQVAIAVIVEQGGSGGSVAAPIARDLMITILNNL